MVVFNIIGNHFKIHWKLATFLICIWAIVIALMFCLVLISPYYTIGQSVLNEFEQTVGGSSSRGSVQSIDLSLLYSLLFKGFGMVIYGIFIMVFINKILLREISSTQISIWLTQPLSKTQLIISKYIFLLILLSLFYLPAFIVLMFFSGFAHDADTLFINMFLGGLQTYIFLIMMSLILYIIALLLVERTIIFNIIASAILCWFILIGSLELMLVLFMGEKSTFLDICNSFVKYGGLQLFLTEVLPYNDSIEPTISIANLSNSGQGKYSGYYFELTHVDDINKVSYGLLNTTMIGISATFVWLSSFLFKTKSFNI